MTPPSASLVGMDQEEMGRIVEELGEPRYRGRQLAHWIYHRAEVDLAKMNDLPGPMRRALGERYVVNPLVIANRLVSRDGTNKLLVHSGDGEVFECVLMPFKNRTSCCLSTQIGCPMGCTFCATGLGGFDRNLSVAEIVGQYLLLQAIQADEHPGSRIGNVVFMGMGEPLLNLDNLVEAMRLLNKEVGLSYRNLTVSTVGIVPKIDELAKLGLPIHLALSLHSPFDEVRTRLMPVNLRWPVAKVMAAMRRYQKATGRKITIEYLLIAGVNDSMEQAKALARLVTGVPSLVNIIPFNYVDTEHGFRRPNRDEVYAFRSQLVACGTNATVRVERGHDIAAACGQLAGAHTGRFAKRRTALTLPVNA